MEKSELDLNDIEDLPYQESNSKHNGNRHSSQDINQLACCLKNAIFSKYVSNYLIEKVEEMWNSYEKRIDQFLNEKHLDVVCDRTRPEMAIALEEIAKHQQENLTACKRDIEILCSSRKRLRNDDKYSVQLQSTQRSETGRSSTRVPKTPRCIDRYEITNDMDVNNIDDDAKRNEIIKQEGNEFSLNTARNNLRRCIFQRGEILPLDPKTKTRTIRITYLCNDQNK